MSNDTVQLTSGKSMLRTSSAVRGRRGGGGGGWGCEANDMRVPLLLVPIRLVLFSLAN